MFERYLGYLIALFFLVGQLVSFIPSSDEKKVGSFKNLDIYRSDIDSLYQLNYFSSNSLIDAYLKKKLYLDAKQQGINSSKIIDRIIMRSDLVRLSNNPISMFNKIVNQVNPSILRSQDAVFTYHSLLDTDGLSLYEKILFFPHLIRVSYFLCPKSFFKNISVQDKDILKFYQSYKDNFSKIKHKISKKKLTKDYLMSIYNANLASFYTSEKRSGILEYDGKTISLKKLTITQFPSLFLIDQFGDSINLDNGYKLTLEEKFSKEQLPFEKAVLDASFIKYLPFKAFKISKEKDGYFFYIKQQPTTYTCFKESKDEIRLIIENIRKSKQLRDKISDLSLRNISLSEPVKLERFFSSYDIPKLAFIEPNTFYLFSKNKQDYIIRITEQDLPYRDNIFFSKEYLHSLDF